MDLTEIKQRSAEIAISYTNGHLWARLTGTGTENELFDHCLRVHYLWGIIKEVREDTGVYYIGSEVISSAVISSVFHKLWHYNGQYNIDLDDAGVITVDNGDDITPPLKEGDVTPESDHYRAGTLRVGVGMNVVSFSSPLSTVNYRIQVYVSADSGYEQRNLVVSTKTTNGFVVNDVLEAGVLTYFCVIDL